MKDRHSVFHSTALAVVGTVFGAVVCAATPPPTQQFEDQDWEARVDWGEQPCCERPDRRSEPDREQSRLAQRVGGGWPQRSTDSEASRRE
jgi:hypothetical protein